jgi:hypothetical protein
MLPKSWGLKNIVSKNADFSHICGKEKAIRAKNLRQTVTKVAGLFNKKRPQ